LVFGRIVGKGEEAGFGRIWDQSIEAEVDLLDEAIRRFEARFTETTQRAPVTPPPNELRGPAESSRARSAGWLSDLQRRASQDDPPTIATPKLAPSSSSASTRLRTSEGVASREFGQRALQMTRVAAQRSESVSSSLKQMACLIPLRPARYSGRFRVTRDA
jgi:hypothetical protein